MKILPITEIIVEIGLFDAQKISNPEISGEDLYLKLKEQGILIRHFSVERIRDYNRITIGTREDMETVIEKISRILKA